MKLPNYKDITGLALYKQEEFISFMKKRFPSLHLLEMEGVKASTEMLASENSTLAKEVARCLCGIRNFLLVVEGSDSCYQELIKPQNTDVLALNQFKDWHVATKEALEKIEVSWAKKDSSLSKDDLKNLAIHTGVILLVVGDAGKSPAIYNKYNMHGDHDAMLEHAMKDGMLDEINELLKEQIDAFATVSKLNCGKAMQGEYSYIELQDILIGASPLARALKYIEFIFDLSGVAGHVTFSGSLVMNGTTYAKTCDLFLALEETHWSSEAPVAYKDKQVKNLLPPEIFRLANLVRASNFKDLTTLLKNFENCDPTTKHILLREMKDNYSFTYGIALRTNIRETGYVSYFKTLARIMQRARVNKLGANRLVPFELCFHKLTSEFGLTNPDHNIPQLSFTFEGKSPVGTPVKNIEFSVNETSGLSKPYIAIGTGGGGDILSCHFGSWLDTSNNVQGYISTRAEFSGSRTKDSALGEKRVPKNSQEISEGVWQITKDSKVSGRAFEPILAGLTDKPLIWVAVPKEDELLQKRLNVAINYIKTARNLEKINLLTVDTGGDSIEKLNTDIVDSSPDQDNRVIKAIYKIDENAEHVIAVPGVDVNLEVLQDFVLLEEVKVLSVVREKVELFYEQTGVTDTTSKNYSKTALSNLACQNNFADQWVALPLPSYLLDDPKNPWDPYIYIHNISKHIVMAPIKTVIEFVS